MSRLLIATDAWRPQVNGVVRTYEQIAEQMKRLGAEIRFMTPDDFPTVPCPGYRQIRLALATPGRVAEIARTFSPQSIHIATEGPIGWAVRAYCRRHRVRFTTSYHTRFPEYLSAHAGIPERITYAFLRRFHNSSSRMMVATPSLAASLRSKGFQRAAPWTRGVDTALFRPRQVRDFGSERPVFLYVGRVSIEKNVEAFLALELPGRKVVVGDGPRLEQLRRRYPEVLFTGALLSETLARAYASADVFVFPSRTDTFGLVLLEAMACGTPVAAYPVTGPLDIVDEGRSGCLDENLDQAVSRAMHLNRDIVRAHAEAYSWHHSARQFAGNLVPIRSQIEENRRHRREAERCARA